MSFGVGLGAFVDGLNKGMVAREALDARRDKRRSKEAFDGINEETRGAFDSAVASGSADPDDFSGFWKEYALPRWKAELMEQGDFARAQQLEEWGQQESTIKGGRLFASSLRKAQTGDYAGALEDAIAAGKTKGYIDTDYDLVSQSPIAGPDGKVVGFRLVIKDDAGEEMEQDIAVEDIPTLIATYANPEAAWQSQQEAAAKKTKRSEDLEDHRAKKVIDREEAAPNDAARYDTTRKELMANDLDFADLSPEEQDAAIRAQIGAADSYAADAAAKRTPPEAGIASASAPGLTRPARPAGGGVIVDTVTGKPLKPSPDEARATSSGLSRPSARSAPMSKADIIKDAADHMSAGGNPQAIAQRLLNAGIGEPEWPEAVRSKYRGTAAPSERR